MFGIFASQNKKMRETAKNWIEMAEKVWNYRRDLLNEAERKELQAATEALRGKVKAKADAADLKLSIEALEPVLAKFGGKIYPKTSMIDNVEFLVFATIVILGIRAFLIQPFKIPTNSMWPSYYGMTGDNLLVKNEEFGMGGKALRFVLMGAFPQELLSPGEGEISVPVASEKYLFYTKVSGRKWLIIPADEKEYVFYVNGREARIRVPYDFNDFDEVVKETLFGGEDSFKKAYAAMVAAGNIRMVRLQSDESSSTVYPVPLLSSGKKVKMGQPILKFDILTGDQLFVDRMSYHFVRPSPGDGFVFRTVNIHSPAMLDAARHQVDSYYIKRLVGVPGDKLEIKTPKIYRNGAPITGSKAFDWNGNLVGLYKGYPDASMLREDGYPAVYLKRGEVLTIPEKSYFAMGDNSYNSADSRYWGYVPEADIVGRPLFIYYPFTKRWGLAK